MTQPLLPDEIASLNLTFPDEIYVNKGGVSGNNMGLWINHPGKTTTPQALYVLAAIFETYKEGSEAAFETVVNENFKLEKEIRKLKELISSAYEDIRKIRLENMK